MRDDLEDRMHPLRTRIPQSALPMRTVTPEQRDRSEYLYSNHHVKQWLRTHSIVPMAVELPEKRKQALEEAFALLDSDHSGTIDQVSDAHAHAHAHAHTVSRATHNPWSLRAWL